MIYLICRMCVSFFFVDTVVVYGTRAGFDVGRCVEVAHNRHVPLLGRFSRLVFNAYKSKFL